MLAQLAYVYWEVYPVKYVSGFWQKFHSSCKTWVIFFCLSIDKYLNVLSIKWVGVGGWVWLLAIFFNVPGCLGWGSMVKSPAQATKNNLYTPFIKNFLISPWIAIFIRKRPKNRMIYYYILKEDESRRFFTNRRSIITTLMSIDYRTNDWWILKKMD
jgi:hypothetical protein